MKIAVTGGKGGTGKSTVATALAVELSKKGKVLLMDMDVDCPNDDLILSAKMKKVRDVTTMIPEFDKNKCTKCGRCAEVCMENAIVQVKGKYPILVADQCTGCRACRLACPSDAITEKRQSIGEILRGSGRVDIITGRIRPGIEESSIVVNAAKRHVKDLEKDYDYIIIDTAAGAHCPVIAALIGVEIAVVVTEPTPLGNHDMRLILELLSKLKIESKAVINRSDIADTGETRKSCGEFKADVIAEIPYDKAIAEGYASGKPMEHPAIKKIAEAVA